MNTDNENGNLAAVRRSCENVLGIFEFRRFEVSEPDGVNTLTGHSEWEVDFYDKDDKLKPVRFVRPPGADEDWYMQEMTRQLREK